MVRTFRLLVGRVNDVLVVDAIDAFVLVGPSRSCFASICRCGRQGRDEDDGEAGKGSIRDSIRWTEHGLYLPL